MNTSCSLSYLKAEIKHLASIFNENHDRFQFISSATDELSCRFIVSSEKCFEFTANVLVSSLKD